MRKQEEFEVKCASLVTRGLCGSALNGLDVIAVEQSD